MPYLLEAEDTCYHRVFWKRGGWHIDYHKAEIKRYLKIAQNYGNYKTKKIKTSEEDSEGFYAVYPKLRFKSPIMEKIQKYLDYYRTNSTHEEVIQHCEYVRDYDAGEAPPFKVLCDKSFR